MTEFSFAYLRNPKEKVRDFDPMASVYIKQKYFPKSQSGSEHRNDRNLLSQAI